MWARQKSGCRGIAYGGKPHILDTMQILSDIWDKDEKYAGRDGIMGCWRKADILPASWNTIINNEVGSASLPARIKQLSEEDCNEFSQLFKRMYVKVQESNIDTNYAVYALQGTFSAESDVADIQDKEWGEMACN